MPITADQISPSVAVGQVLSAELDHGQILDLADNRKLITELPGIGFMWQVLGVVYTFIPLNSTSYYLNVDNFDESTFNGTMRLEYGISGQAASDCVETAEMFEVTEKTTGMAAGVGNGMGSALRALKGQVWGSSILENQPLYLHAYNNLGAFTDGAEGNLLSVRMTVNKIPVP